MHGHSHEGPKRRAFAGGVADIEVHGHHEATVVSTTVTTAPAFGVSVSALADGLERLAERIEAAGGFVGHLKAFAAQGSSFVRVSVTDAREHAFVQGDEAFVVQGDCCLQVVAIAFVGDAAVLENDVVCILERLLGEEDCDVQRAQG